MRRAVELFRDKCPQVQQQVPALENLVVEAGRFGIGVSSSAPMFIIELCREREFLRSFTEYLLGTPHPVLGYLMQDVLRVHRNTDVAEYRKVGITAATQTDVSVALGAAGAVCYGPYLGEPIPEDADILSRLIAHPDMNVRRITFTGIGRLGNASTYTEKALTLLLNVDIGDDPKLADEMCEALGPGRIDPRVLSEGQVRTILNKLVPTRELSSHNQYHLEKFLNWAAQSHPQPICEFILRRLDHYAAIQLQATGKTEYCPVPYHEFGTHFGGLRQTEYYGRFLAQIRDRLLAGDEQYWLTSLFWAVGASDTTTLSVIDDWMHSGDRDKLEALRVLLSQAPSRLALSRPWFAVHMVEVFASVDPSLGDRVTGTLVANAHTGMMTSAPG